MANNRESILTTGARKLTLLFICLLSAGILSSGCAPVKLGSIHRPAETAKLRVAVLPVSANLARGRWGTSDEKFADDQYKLTRNRLDQLGYYEVVPETEMKTVLGEYTPERWTLLRNNAELSLQIGAALYADYILLADRGTLSGDPHYYFEVMLINIDSGKRFEVRINNTRRQGERKLPVGTGKVALRELFRDAKEDLVSTAIRKSRTGDSLRIDKLPNSSEANQPKSEAEGSDWKRRIAEAETLKTAGQEQTATLQAEEERKAKEKKEAELAEEARQRAQAGEEKRSSERLSAARQENKPAKDNIEATAPREVQYLDADQEEQNRSSDAKRLIVYDFVTSSDTYRPTALILSEALREEIQSRGGYNIVNRENIQLLMNEMKLQQSDLIDGRQASQVGKLAGAQEFVTGNLGALGRTLVLQSKRTDIQTMLNLSLASLKSEVGQEDSLLTRLADMVDKLLQKQEPVKNR